MVLADSNLVKRDKVRNPRNFDWYNMVGMQFRYEPGRICDFWLIEAYANAEILIQRVEDYGNHFNIVGLFLDLDEPKDTGRWYLVEMNYIKSLEYAAIEFTPCPIQQATPFNKDYIDKRRSKNPQPS